jgi:hypothetical protein
VTLGDQLDELRTNILRDISALVAGDDDRMWSDETLLRYIGDAERRFARETMCLRDGTTPKLTRLTLRAGVKNYPLDDAVFAVVSARPDGRDYDLQRTGHALVQARELDTSITFDPAEASTLQPGAPLGFYTDETIVFGQEHKVTLSIYPAPDADAAGTVVNLRVIRVPCGGYTTGDLKRESEIPRDYQFDVLDWAAYRAKRNNDADIGATPNAADHKDAFEQSIARCKRDMRARMRVGTGLRYGANGFTWSR